MIETERKRGTLLILRTDTYLHRLFSFIDRSNIGNANIAGLSTKLGLEGTQYNVALLVFYIPCIIADVPSNLLVKRFRAGVYLPTLITL